MIRWGMSFAKADWSHGESYYIPMCCHAAHQYRAKVTHTTALDTPVAANGMLHEGGRLNQCSPHLRCRYLHCRNDEFKNAPSSAAWSSYLGKRPEQTWSIRPNDYKITNTTKLPYEPKLLISCHKSTERRSKSSELNPKPVPPLTALKTRKPWRSVQLSASFRIRSKHKTRSKKRECNHNREETMEA